MSRSHLTGDGKDRSDPAPVLFIAQEGKYDTVYIGIHPTQNLEGFINAFGTALLQNAGSSSLSRIRKASKQ
ncbi:MAG: hypothetical protein JW861_10350 [Bacteroidales bacterium]|nr:hypothetical protein [Bacteroidales bacterium]